MVLAGARVRVFDRENGKDVYGRWLQSIIRVRDLTEAQQNLIDTALRYHAFPVLKKLDTEALVELALDASDDLIVFDSQRMFLTDLGLKEKESDDYAEFMSYLIDPLHRVQVATLILDNTGHADKSRARGTASKGDLNEVMFTLSQSAEFGPMVEATVTLKTQQSRFGNYDTWSMQIGGGRFSGWQAAADHFRTDLYRAVLTWLRTREGGAGQQFRGQDKIIAGVRSQARSNGGLGVRFDDKDLRRWLQVWTDKGWLVHGEKGGYRPAAKPTATVVAPNGLGEGKQNARAK
jgi:hypothetical protein